MKPFMGRRVFLQGMGILGGVWIFKGWARPLSTIPLPCLSLRDQDRLIKKIYEVDPLICPQCRETMRIISMIEDQAVIDKILDHLGLWRNNQRPSNRKN
jgi:hypothetical protein